MAVTVGHVEDMVASIVAQNMLHSYDLHSQVQFVIAAR
jgi:hypothetical protein